MDILLLHPRTPDTFWSFRHAVRFVSKRASMPPLGLLTVAAMLDLGPGLARMLFQDRIQGMILRAPRKIRDYIEPRALARN